MIPLTLHFGDHGIDGIESLSKMRSSLKKHSRILGREPRPHVNRRDHKSVPRIVRSRYCFVVRSDRSHHLICQIASYPREHDKFLVTPRNKKLQFIEALSEKCNWNGPIQRMGSISPEHESKVPRLIHHRRCSVTHQSGGYYAAGVCESSVTAPLETCDPEGHYGCRNCSKRRRNIPESLRFSVHPKRGGKYTCRESKRETDPSLMSLDPTHSLSPTFRGILAWRVDGAKGA